ncbi:MAG: dihydrofolate reductase family protein [bacterium]|nr:dihydrofolate reductase family protein [bacterium]
MRKIIVFNNVTLDGVLQAPGKADEDLRGEFRHGGWAVPYGAMQSPEASESMPGFRALLLGRRTYEQLYDYWPKQTNNPFTEMLNTMPKYVVSTTLQEPLPWSNSILLKGDAVALLRTLQQQEGDDLVVMGSGQLIRSLVKHNLVDRYVLLIHPLVLGSGQRLFGEDDKPMNLQLNSVKATANGVIVATYLPANPSEI